MKLKQIGAVVSGMLLVTQMLAQEEKRSVPSLEQVTSIHLKSSPTEWGARFYPNGAAMLVFGGIGGFRQAAAPKGSFSFEGVYNFLAPRLKSDGDIRSFMPVLLHVVSEGSNVAWYLEHTDENTEQVRLLMRGLRDKAFPTGTSVLQSTREDFERLFATYPLVHGDEPTPVVYNNHDEGMVRNAWADIQEEQKKADDAKLRVLEKQQNQGKELPEYTQPELATEETPAAGVAETAEDTPLENGEATASSPRRPWLPYAAAALCAICAVTVFWLFRKRR